MQHASYTCIAVGMHFTTTMAEWQVRCGEAKTAITCWSILAVGLHIRSAGFCQDDIIPEVPHLQGSTPHTGSHTLENMPLSTQYVPPAILATSISLVHCQPATTS